MKSKGISCILAILLALFAISASVAVPILCRPFYYAHIEALDMPEKTGWTHEQIRRAYDDMMDFELKGADFATGDLKWSEDGMTHFADCKVLFLLDLRILAVTGILLLAAWILFRSKKDCRLAAFSINLPENGGLYRARTCDLFHVKEALIPAELTARVWQRFIILHIFRFYYTSSDFSK